SVSRLLLGVTRTLRFATAAALLLGELALHFDEVILRCGIIGMIFNHLLPYTLGVGEESEPLICVPKNPVAVGFGLLAQSRFDQRRHFGISALHEIKVCFG